MLGRPWLCFFPFFFSCPGPCVHAKVRRFRVHCLRTFLDGFCFVPFHPSTLSSCFCPFPRSVDWLTLATFSAAAAAGCLFVVGVGCTSGASSLHCIARTVWCNSRPHWGETFKFALLSLERSLVVQVWDADELGADVLLGEVSLRYTPHVLGASCSGSDSEVESQVC